MPNLKCISILVAAAIAALAGLAAAQQFPQIPCQGTYTSTNASASPVGNSCAWSWSGQGYCQWFQLSTPCNFCVAYQIQVRDANNNWAAYTLPQAKPWSVGCTAYGSSGATGTESGMPAGSYRLYVLYWIGTCGQLLFDPYPVPFTIN